MMELPTEFVPLTIVIPGIDRPDLLGYSGDARFVGFYWDAKAGGAVWSDGREGFIGRGENFTFIRFIRPLGFLYNVNFGTRGGKATHILVWDRDQANAYVALRESAVQFLRENNGSYHTHWPADFSGPMQ
jgi:hypothetical protein